MRNFWNKPETNVQLVSSQTLMKLALMYLEKSFSIMRENALKSFARIFYGERYVRTKKL